ncbi:MAG: hypothetical protein NT092_12095 [Bacteroidia bacterium]|nr:hypothetical protein [Bacteroidia bacterium]
MRKKLLIPALLLGLLSCNIKPTVNQSLIQFIDSTYMTNNFYDNTRTYELPVMELTVEGEVANPGEVDFSSLPKHSVIVKEALLDSTGDGRFTGAFRYDGYSLFDILEKVMIRKANTDEFSSIIDLYIEIGNDKGEKVVFSWGEIYYPNNLHKILIASNVSRIIPSRTKELWALPESSRIVAAADLITERNISDPVRITVKSYPKSILTVKGMSPIYSEKILLYKGKEQIGELTSIPGSIKNETFNTIFYGRGKGIHSTTPFTGVLLREVLVKYYPVNRDDLRFGIMCITGQDGYRCALSYSELFNRNDQQEFLLIKTAEGEDGGLFRMFAASDFFSDRAIKSVSGIHLGY